MKQLISQIKFIEKCNEELKKDSSYTNGMEFVEAPEDDYGEKISDVGWVGPENKIGVFTRAKYNVRRQYAIELILG